MFPCYVFVKTDWFCLFFDKTIRIFNILTFGFGGGICLDALLPEGGLVGCGLNSKFVCRGKYFACW